MSMKKSSDTIGDRTRDNEYNIYVKHTERQMRTMKTTEKKLKRKEKPTM
jgi:hypothetical protein